MNWHNEISGLGDTLRSNNAFNLLTPIDSETKWSSLLATFIALDASPLTRLFDASLSTTDKVHCEFRSRVTKDFKQRADVYMEQDEGDVIIECKVLSAIDPEQLAMYEKAFPNAKHRLVVAPAGIRPPQERRAGWLYATWDELFELFGMSSNSWVRETSEMWVRSLFSQLPKVESSTPWNGISSEEPFILAMRARVVWIAHSLTPSSSVTTRFGQSSKGVSWTTGFQTSAGREGYRLILDVEEQLPVQQFPYKAEDPKSLIVGPAIRIFLLQEDVSSSRDFEWDHLAELWPTLKAAGYSWFGSPRPRADHDKRGLDRIRHKYEIPKFVGVGYGNAQTRLTNSCMFGVKCALDPSLTLEEIAEEVNGMKKLMRKLSLVPWST